MLAANNKRTSTWRPRSQNAPSTSLAIGLGGPRRDCVGEALRAKGLPTPPPIAAKGSPDFQHPATEAQELSRRPGQAVGRLKSGAGLRSAQSGLARNPFARKFGAAKMQKRAAAATAAISQLHASGPRAGGRAAI